MFNPNTPEGLVAVTKYSGGEGEVGRFGVRKGVVETTEDSR